MGKSRNDLPTKLIIIGYGNPLRGDDGVGWRIAEQLAEFLGDSARVMAVHQLTPELAEPIGEAELAIFIDACHGGQPGSWTCETIQPDPKGAYTFTHHFTPMNLLSYAEAVFNAHRRALLISVAGGSFDCGDELSPGVAGIVAEIVTCVCEWWGDNAGTSDA